MFRIMDRYLSREFLRLFVVFVLGAPLLFIIGDLVDHLDRYIDEGRTVRVVFLNYLYQMPLFILWSFPIAALIATIFTVSNMTRHSEVAAAKAGGISFHRLTLPLVTLGALLTVAALGLTELVPVTTRLKAQVMGERPAQGAKADFVYRSGAGDVYAIRRLDVEDGRIDQLTVEREGDEPRIPGVTIQAERALFLKDQQRWRLEVGSIRLFPAPGKEQSWGFKSLVPTQLRDTPEQLLAIPKAPEEMGYRELGRYVEILRHSGGRPFRLMVQQAQKIAIPVATLIIVLFGAPLANASPRGGTAYGIGISLAITIFYMMLFKVSGGLANGGSIPPWLGAWAPNILFLVAAAWLQIRVET
ncbi:MAG TPA: LptF/LptG family permease [Longimicrobiales bacterium]